MLNTSTPSGLFYLFQFLQADVYRTKPNLGSEQFPKNDANQDGDNDWIILDFDADETTDPYFDGSGDPFVNAPEDGFAAAAYYNTVTKEVVISYRGTEPIANIDGVLPTDLKNDIQLAFGELPIQLEEAQNFYGLVKSYLNGQSSYEYNGTSLEFDRDENSPFGYSSISFTGHSLGGGLAQFMGAQYGHRTITFNALGMDILTRAYLSEVKGYTDAKINETILRNKDLITNYIVNGDFVSNTYDHIGNNKYATIGSLTGAFLAAGLLGSVAFGEVLPAGLIGALTHSVFLHLDTMFDYPFTPFGAFSQNKLNTEGQFLHDFLGTIAKAGISLVDQIKLMQSGLESIIDHLYEHGYTNSGTEEIIGKNPQPEMDPVTGVLKGSVSHTVVLDSGLEIEISGNTEILTGSNNNSKITKAIGDSIQFGQGGEDTLNGGVNNDLLFGGDDNDILVGSRGSDTLIGGSGDDTYHFAMRDGADVIIDSEGDNTLIFGAGITEADVTFSTSSQGAHIISLNGAPDQIVVQGSIEHYVFEDETVEDPFGVTDILAGVLNQSDTLVGGSGQDYVYGDPESIFSSGSGSYAYTASNDLLDGGSGRDTLSGDSFNVRARNYSTVTVQSGHDTVLGGSGGDELRGDGQLSFERTTSGSYTISVTTGNDALDGGSGNDTLDGDVLLSAEVDNNAYAVNGTIQAGNDTLLGGRGHDFVTGDGNFNFEGLSQNVSNRTLTFGNDSLHGGTGNDTLVGDGYTSLTWNGSSYNSSIITTFGNDTLLGGDGNDVLQGDWDVLAASNGMRSTLQEASVVNGGNDSLVGGAGNDTLYGDFGNDTLNGGLGNDVYQFDPDSGLDSILETGSSLDTDTVLFGAGIDSLDVTFSKQGLDLVVNYGSSQITVKDQFNLLLTEGRIENFQFNDNTAITWEDILLAQGDASSTITGSSAADFINATSTYQTIDAGGGNDYIQLASLGDVANGGAGNDTIDAGSGNDTLLGGTGDDTFIVNASNVVITENANEGNDTLISSLTQTLSAHVENLILTGTSNVNGSGNTADNQLTGNDGDNTLDGGSGIDTLMGGAGDDTYVVDHISDQVIENAEQGHDLVQSSVHYQLGNHLEDLTLTGSASLFGVGNALDNVIQGNTGNNTLNGGAGADTLIGDSGDDTFVIDNLDDVILETDPGSTDTVIATIDYTLGSTLENLTLFGGGNNTATGNALDNTIIGNNGNNILQGLTGSDSLDGGAGNDTYQFSGTWGADTITADASGNDTLDFTGTTAALTVDLDSTGTEVTDGTNTVSWSGTFIENVMSGSGDDSVTGNAANNLLEGAGGNDTLDGDAGDDTYKFSNNWGIDTIAADASGNDTVDLSTLSANLTIDLDSIGTEVTDGTNTIDWSGSIIENVLSGSGADSITGSSSANLILGGQGNDTLDGDAGDDTYIFADNWGVDALSDSAGNDTANLSMVTANLTIDLDTTGIEITDGTNSTNWSGTAIENISAGSGHDSITGTASGNQLSGGGGNDTLDGEAGNDTYQFTSNWGGDTLSDSAGTDTVDFTGNVSNLTVDLDSIGTGVTDGSNSVDWSGTIIENATGGSGADSITGHSGNNLLNGGMGIDTLAGEAGDDVYVVDNSLDVVIENSAEGTDTVQASASYMLSANVEHLTLTGTGFISGTGNSLANQITGNSGNNTLDGLAGNDTLDGDAGDDTYQFSGSWGADTITADSSGIDTVDLSEVSNALTIDLDSSGSEVTDGTNTVNWSGTIIENAIGGTAADSIAGNASDNRLVGNGGNDTLDGEAGNDTYAFSGVWAADSIVDSAGTDTVDMSGVSANLTIDLDSSGSEVTDGTNTVNWSGTIIENVTAGSGNDALNGSSVANVLMGNGGNDTLDAEGGNDTISGGSGNDLLVGGIGNDNLDGGSGDDTYQFSDTWGVDTITADASGSDTVDLSSVSTSLTIDLDSTGTEVTDGTNTVNWSGTFIENVISGSGNDSITGSALNNVLNGGTGNDTLDGEAGDDTYQFSGSWGADTITADSSGIDTVDLSEVSNALTIDLDSSGSEVTDGTHTVNWSGTIIENAIGGTAADSITGNASDNRLVGNGGNDTLDGEAGNDTYAFSGVWAADSIVDSAGTDTVDMSGVSANLTIDLDSSGSEVTDGTHTVNWSGTIIENVTAGSGNDALNGSSVANVLMGNGGNDTLDGEAGHDTISGGSGNDLLVGGIGNDNLDGGSGDDTYQFSDTWGVDTITADASGSDTVDLSSVSASLTIDLDSTATEVTDGTNTIDWSGLLIENVVGGSGNDSITGNLLNNRITGGQGNDTLEGEAGNDTYAFADGWGQDQLSDSSGTDTLDFSTVSAGLTLNLETTGTEVTDGTNTVNWSGTLVENLTAGSGADAMTGSASENTLSGGAGNDTLSAAGGNDLLSGGAGNDQLDGGSGDDTYQFTGTWGADTISGDASGRDVVDFSTIATGLTINLETVSTEVTDGTNTVNWSGSLIEDALGGTDNDSMTGSSAANLLWGNEGNDSLDGAGGNDTLLGSVGNDTLDGGTGDDQYVWSGIWGSDTLSGDASGVDTLDFSGVSANLAVDLDSSGTEVTNGTDTVNWDSATIQIENVLGGSGSDGITGNVAANSLSGADGNDTLSAEAGNDTLVGGAGNDSLDGGADNDVYQFSGTWGQDVLSDSAGVDTLDLSGVFSALNIDLDAADTQVSDGVNTLDWTGATIEQVIAGAGNDFIAGNSQNNTLIGGSGQDTLSGAGGNDSLDGGSGSDTYQFAGTWGSDTIADSAGIDSIDLSTISSALTIDLDTASTEVTDGTHTVNWSGVLIENAVGGSGHDSITGNTAENLLTGGAGNDTLTAEAGNDTLLGGVGSDSLDGGSGDDTYQFTDTWGNDTISSDTSGTDSINFSTVSSALTIDLESVGTEVTDGTNTVTWTGTFIENATGGTGDDSITGSAFNNRLSGNVGADSLFGEDGNDTLLGGAGNDSLDGGSGNDTYQFSGTWGSDTITADTAGSDTLNFSGVIANLTIDMASSGIKVTDGSNTVNWSGNLVETVVSGAGHDLLTGNQEANLLEGGAGNDTIDGALGNDTFVFRSAWGVDSLSDGGGSETVDFSSVINAVTINLASSAGDEATDGQSTVNWSSDVIENAVGGYGNDSITGNLGDNVLSGGMGNDTLSGEGGNDTLAGGAGNDSLDGGSGNNVYVIARNWGTDTIVDASGSDTLDLSVQTTGLAIDLSASSGNVMEGLNSLSWTGSIFEHASTGSGNDSLIGSMADNVLVAGDGQDILDGGDGADTLLGGEGNDTLEGGIGNDSLNGEGGDDTYYFYDQWGQDALTDSSGWDRVYFDTVTNDLTVTLLDTGTSSVSDGVNTVNWQSSTIEFLLAGQGHDTISGNASNNEVWGYQGNDLISTGNGSDTLYGGAGNDTLQGGDSYDYYYFQDSWGQDTISDSSGTWDRVSFDSVSSNLTINLTSSGSAEVSDGTNTVNWSSSEIEDVFAGQGHDSVTGNSANNSIWGFWGNDTLVGGSGTDTLDGGGDNDDLSGGTANDTLYGGAGDDIYQFATGDGQDVISDTGDSDTVLFDSSVSLANVVFYQTGAGNLQIGYTNSSGDLITIQGQSSSGTAVERFELNNGQYMTDADVNQVLSDMSAYATTNSISLTSLDDVKADANLVAIVNGGWHS